MKATLILLSVLTAGTLAAQPQKPVDHNLKTDTSAASKDIVIFNRPAAAGSAAGHKVVYSGAFVQFAHAKQPLQMLNPFAPAEYGDGHQNLDRDIITGKVTGFKLISVDF
ncbi:MAG TPA: hypothetical protein VH413_14535 [Verrucomicrobiae bacterium]|jgi:hypothetical protein|nr:hypothetical protein [Verrucomicrobiae bacterium]